MILPSLRSSRRHRPSLKSRLTAYNDWQRAQADAEQRAKAIEAAAPRHAPGWVCVLPESCPVCTPHRKALAEAARIRREAGIAS